jgi:ABC-type transport system involved in cytochrome c biogenesis permease subunit
MWPWFRIVMYSQRKPLRRLALLVVVMMGLAAFFYPLRMVPSEKFGAVFIGLGAAVVALSVLASMLIVLYRFFESEGKH